MRADDVIEALDVLDRVGMGYWVGGGWAVVALAGRQSREQRDLDLIRVDISVPVFTRPLPEYWYFQRANITRQITGVTSCTPVSLLRYIPSRPVAPRFRRIIHDAQ
jgi:hypothetical protein